MVVKRYEAKALTAKGVAFELGKDDVKDIDLKGNLVVIKKGNETIRINTASGVITTAEFDGQPLSNDQRSMRGMKAAEQIAH